MPVEIQRCLHFRHSVDALPSVKPHDLTGRRWKALLRSDLRPGAPVAERNLQSFQFLFFRPHRRDPPTAVPRSHGFFLSVGLFSSASPHLTSLHPSSRLTALPSAGAAALRPKRSHSEALRLTRPAALAVHMLHFLKDHFLFLNFLFLFFFLGGRD